MAELETSASFERYQGETAPRRLLVVIALNLLMPGLGHIYCGHPRRGLAVFLGASVALVSLIVLAWTARLFLPRALGIAVVGWFYLQVTLASRAVRMVARTADDYVLRSYNHPIAYAGLVFALEVLPIGLLLTFAQSYALVTLNISDRNEFPRLIEGDRVYGARVAFDEDPPSHGELVVVEGLISGQTPGQKPGRTSALTILRVVAVPGDEIELDDGALIVNGDRRYREPLGRVEALGFEPPPAALEGVHAFREFDERGSYEVFVPEGVDPPRLKPQRLGDDQYFLIADLRGVDRVIDSRQVGPVDLSQIIGRPYFVWWSQDGERVRWRRLGLGVL